MFKYVNKEKDIINPSKSLEKDGLKISTKFLVQTKYCILCNHHASN